jgi:hypothetical protein
MRRIGRTSAVFVAAMACLSFSAAAASAASAATVQPSSALKARSSVAPEAAPQASAAVPDAYGAILCQGDVCIQSQCAHCDVQNINAWANTYTFTGHFELTFGCSIAGCNNFNSPNRSWPRGGTHWTFDGVPAATISASVRAWKGGPPWHAIGNVGFYL